MKKPMIPPKTFPAILLAAALTAELAACAPQPSSVPAESTAVTTSAATDVATADTAVPQTPVNFSFRSFAVSGDTFYYAADDAILRSENGGEWEPFFTVPDSDLRPTVGEVFADGDTLYYTLEYDENISLNRELYRFSAYSGSELLFSLSGSGYSVDPLAARGDDLYYRCDDVLSVFNRKTELTQVLDAEGVETAYAIGDKLYFLSKTVEEEPDYRTFYHLQYVDLDTPGIRQVTDAEIDTLYRDGDALYYLTTDDAEERTRAIYKVGTAEGTAEKLLTVSAENKLHIIGVTNGMILYQNYNREEGSFTTFTQASGGEPHCRENVTCKFDSLYFPVQNCFQFNGRSYLYYDEDKDDFSFFTAYGRVDACNGHYFCYASYEDGEEKPCVKPLELQPDLPKTNSETPPADNEWLRLKKCYYNEYGYLFLVPELTLDSADAAAVNREIDGTEEDHGMCYRGQYYYRETAEHYLTFYVRTGVEGGGKYQLYTFDVHTGSRLGNEEVIALITDDTEDFRDQLTQALRDVQRDIFLGVGTNREREDFSVTETKPRELGEEETVPDYPEAYNSLDKMQLGYLGDGRVLCVATFRMLAGAEYGSRIFEFTYQP